MNLHALGGSSRLVGYGYEPRQELLALKFRDGSVWLYAGVPESVFEGFLLADSRGSFFERVIRPGYEGRRAEGLDGVG